jgi:hypothetical protein
MTTERPFQHLPLPLRYRGDALLPRGGKQSAQTKDNKSHFAAHAAVLHKSALSASDSHRQHRADRQRDNLPGVPNGIPILLQVDPDLDLSLLREKFNFEIVSEQEDGYVIVASEDVQLSALLKMINEFSTEKRGSATIASIHRLFDDPTQDERLKQILSDTLYQAWPKIRDDQIYVCDIGIGGLGSTDIPDLPTRGKRDSDADWARKEAEWSQRRTAAYQAWDDVKCQREDEVARFVRFYAGQILNIVDGCTIYAIRLPDSFTVRVELPGKGLRDLVLNYSYVFEVVEPDDVELPQHAKEPSEQLEVTVVPRPPNSDAPVVCVIDGGIQEGHRLLVAAIDADNSRCFLPNVPPTEVGDYVQPGGHGTRVAGAILYGESVPQTGEPILECWVQNARVLDNNCSMPDALFPPAAMRAIVERYNNGTRQTKLFNHSINATAPCRTQHMSAWAAEIDALSEQRDVLVVQSAGNIGGVESHLAAGREYPWYLTEASCRVANPAQSLQALTVGSVAYGSFESAGWRSFATQGGHPSSFSRSGFGIWDVIKPEVVEYGGDDLRMISGSAKIGRPSIARPCYPELVRSTMYPPGPAIDRDDVGTSYAAPKVTRIAAKLQELLPLENCLLYRALIVQSARWPTWTSWALEASEELGILRLIGYGIPNIDRATTNTEYRTTLFASKDPRVPEQDLRVRAGECHFFQVPIPAAMRRPGQEHDILIEVTLSYAAQPRRTRRKVRRYLSTWVDWKSSKLREPIERFRLRAMKDQEEDEGIEHGTPIPWMLDARPNWGRIRGVKRSAGTVQKDWAVVKSNQLPDDFCIAVVGHRGWSYDPDSSARYALTVSFEVVGKQIKIYEDVRVAVERLRADIEAEAET